MRVGRILPVIAVSLLGIALAPPTGVSAVDIPPGALDFSINVDPPSADQINPSCDKTPTQIGTEIFGGATSVTLTCTVTNPNQAITGTASNATLAAQDAGFNNGTLSAKCNAQQKFTTTLSVTGSGASTPVAMSSLSGTVLQACSFSLKFADAQQSSLAGTIELNATAASDPSSFATSRVISFAFTAKVFVTSGTGAFTGLVGSGEFSQAQSIDLSSSVPPASGGGTPTGTPPELPSNPEEFCRLNPSQCTLQQSHSVRTGSVRKMATPSKMTLTLAKPTKGGVVRIVAPTAPVGQTTGSAIVTAKSKVSLVATPKSVCTVKTNTGKVVGKGTVKASGLLKIKPASNAYTGAKSIKATCTLNKKTFSSSAVKVALKK